MTPIPPDPKVFDRVHIDNAVATEGYSRNTCECDTTATSCPGNSRLCAHFRTLSVFTLTDSPCSPFDLDVY